MGDAQSAQRENKKDAAAQEESGAADDARTEPDTEDKLLTNEKISEINGKAEESITEVNSHCEDEIAPDASLSPKEDDTEKPPEEDTPLENVEINEKASPNEADADEVPPVEITEIDAKQNDINESFRKFFSNIGLKLTVKRGSTDITDETKKEESNSPEDVKETTNEPASEEAEQRVDLNAAQETYDNDSTTCPTLTDVTSEDVQENVDEKTTTETKQEVESDHVDAAKTSPKEVDTATALPGDEEEKAQQDATHEEDIHPTSTTSPEEEEEVVSPIKRFFTTGIFSGLRKKKKSIEDETTERELIDMRKKETEETTDKTVEVQQEQEEASPDVQTEHEDKLKEPTDDGPSPPADETTLNGPEITNSQEKVEASPLKRLLSGSSFKKPSKKQRERKPSDAKLSDSGEHSSDHLMSSTESTENQKEERPAQQTEEAAGEEESAWASFKKLMTPKKRMKRPSLNNEETQIQSTLEETKPNEGEQLSDQSNDEGKKRKDSSVSWEAVLCGSGRRRSRGRKTSDSEDETPQAENDKRQESQLESSNEVDDNLVPKQAGSHSEDEGGSTWKSFKKLVTPKRKSKNDEESKDNIQSDSDIAQDDSSFSIKKLIPGRKKRKSAEKQDQASSDEADKEAASGDEDSETPAVVPLSEFDTPETEVQVKTQADVESHVSKETDELQQDPLNQISEQMQTEAEKIQEDENVLDKEATPAPVSSEEPEDLTALLSKHQQLSDIPEEGVITDTMATPASVNEEAARDDTLAEDLIEITSEAITAPEPVDSTLADETTEMISAVSQLSESSKTSGNTTPVPEEYDVKHTETLLHQVVETISISAKEVPVCTDDVNSERIVGSVSHQILQTFVKTEPTVLEIHRRSDATAINTGLSVQELDAVNELAATAQTESISEVNETVSTEMVSEVSTEEFDTADITVDEVHEVSVSYPEESIKTLESTDESRGLVEGQSEVNEGESIETLPKHEEVVADVGSLVGTHKDEQEPQETETQKLESAATVTEESKDEDVDQEEKENLETETQEAESTATVVEESKDEGIDQEEKENLENETQKLETTATVVEENKDEGIDQEEKENLETEIQEAETTATVVEESKDEDVDQKEKENLETETQEAESTATVVEQSKEDVTEEEKEPLETETQEAESAAPVEEKRGDGVEQDEIETLETDSQEAESAVVVTKEIKDVDVEEDEKEPPEINSKKEESAVTEAEEIKDVDVEQHKKEPQEPDSQETEPVSTEAEEIRDVDVEKDEKETLETDSQETESTVTVAEERKDGGLEQEREELQETKPAATEEESKVEGVTQDVQTLTQEDQISHSITDQVQVEDKDQAQAVEDLQEEATAPLDLEANGDQLLEKEVISQDTPAEEIVTDKPKDETEPLTEGNAEAERENKQDAAINEKLTEEEKLEAEQTSPSDTEERRVQSPLLDVPAVETETEETKQATENLIEASVEPQNKEVETDTSNITVAEVAEKEVISDHRETTETETVSDEVKSPSEESELLVTQPVDVYETEQDQEEEEIEATQTQKLDLEESVQSLEKEVRSEEIISTETVTQTSEGSAEADQVPSAEDVQTEHVESSEHDITSETQTELESFVHAPVAPESVEDVPKQEAESDVIGETESKGVAELNQASECTSQDIQAGQDPHTIDVIPPPCVDVAAVTHEAQQEVLVGEVQTNLEREKASELPDAEIMSGDVANAVVTQVITCYLKDVSPATPDVLTEKTSDVGVALINLVASEVEVQDTIETTTLIEKEVTVTERAEEGSTVMTVNVPSVQLEDNHRIQVQVVHIDINSAETVVDTVLEVGVTQAKEVIDVCHETVKEVDQLCATSETEETVIDQENKVSIQEVVQHVKEKLPETKPESVIDNLDQDVTNQPDAVTQESEVAQSEVEHQKVMEDRTECAAISDDSTEQKVSEDLTPTPDQEEVKDELEKVEADITTEEVKVSSQELDVKKSNQEALVPQTTQNEVVTPSNTGLVAPQNTGIISSIGNVESPSSLSLEFKLNIQFGQTKAPASPPPPMERVEPVKQTEVSEVGVQAEEPEQQKPPTPAAEIQKQTEVSEVGVQAEEPEQQKPPTPAAEIQKQTEVSEVGVQAEEPEQQKPPTPAAETEKQTELTEVTVQATEITESKPENLDSTYIAVIMAQPVVMDAVKQAIETVARAEQIKSTEIETSNIQVKESVRQTEEREAVQTPLVSETSNQEIKAKKPVKQTEEEDVWMDAEEDIDTKQDAKESPPDVDEPLDHKAEGDQEEKAALEQEVETTPPPQAEEESQQETTKTAATCDVESESEDFAFALEQPDSTTTSVTRVECD